ncbi:hypothetical protein EXIGLDRAFT_830237 [Exidia glandulosa HHB12029]|uniref:Ketoacyl-synt-domain-containing protein n=1 Tax=Exidia glandulosa HHB12029 TaxID=1314781 RepID=A0A165NVM2_EXIGL|nr:hypothetical protein EXIGLDRAFT_830237 [Exidia glandulosa HHB12029]
MFQRAPSTTSTRQVHGTDIAALKARAESGVAADRLEYALRMFVGCGVPKDRKNEFFRWLVLAHGDPEGPGAPSRVPRSIRGRAFSLMANAELEQAFRDPESLNISALLRAADHADNAAALGFVSSVVLFVAKRVDAIGARSRETWACESYDYPYEPQFSELESMWEAWDRRTEEMAREKAKLEKKVAKAPSAYRCATPGCGIVATKKAALSRCSRCTSDEKAHYCSKECQVQVGIAARLPSGAHSSSDFDYQSFNEFLLAKGESYERIPADRLNIDALQGRALGQILPQNGSFLKNLDKFDHVEFGITAKDARVMSVGTRVLVELAFLALVDSGINYRGANIGCYMSAVAHDMYMLSGQDELEAKGSFAHVPAMVANRISYHMDLRGPSLPLDTACSSSLTATHLAMQAISMGECESAVVGGSQINLRAVDWVNYSIGGILSADGKCKPFDAHADGFSRGEGAVVIVLKRLDAAMRDGDKIYGTILGTAINSNGGRQPAYAPDAVAQEKAMYEAFRRAGRQPSEVDFIELHATGTARGDPTEANWVGRAFQRDTELLIGSVKGNVGHLEITAFLASLCKVCSMMQTGEIPPTVNMSHLNPAIRWDEYRMRVALTTERLPCRSQDGKSLISMTSSGIGGSNGHCIVESPPKMDTEGSSPFWTNAPSHYLVIAGALSPRSLPQIIDTVNAEMKGNLLADVCLTFNRRARSMPWRSFTVAGGERSVTFSTPRLSTSLKTPNIFVFSGRGPQHLLMGKDLFHHCIPFRDTVMELDSIFLRSTGKSLRCDYGLFDGKVGTEALGDIWPIAVTLPALTVFQLALFDALTALGVKPDAVVGHSAGEVATIYASGAGSKALALEVAIARGRAMSILERHAGTMAAVNCSALAAHDIIREVLLDLGDGSLEIACYNADEAVTLSGSVENVELAVAKAKARGLFAIRLRTRVPVYCSMMELCEDQYRLALRDVFSRYPLSPCVLPVYSAATGLKLDGRLDEEYFWINTRGPVLFTDAIRSAVEGVGSSSFVEISPHPVLASYLQALLPDSAVIVCPARRPNRKLNESAVEVSSFLAAVGSLAAVGCSEIDFKAMAGPRSRVLQSPPNYPLAPKAVPYRISSYDTTRYLQPRLGPLNYKNMRINALTHPSLADHVIKDEPIMPAAGYIEMALEFGARTLWNVEFRSIIPLSADRFRAVEISSEGSLWLVKTPSSHAVSDLGLKFDKVNARGFMSKAVEGHNPSVLDLAGIAARCQPLPMRSFYAELQRFGLQYGPHYRRIESMAVAHDDQLGTTQALVGIRAYTADLDGDPPFVLHPAILDAAFHAMAHPSVTGVHDPTLYMLPARIQSIVTHDALYDPKKPVALIAHIISREWTPDSVTWDCVLADTIGTPVCTIRGLEFATHGQSFALSVLRRYGLSMTSLGAIVQPDVVVSAHPPTPSSSLCYTFMPLAEHLPNHYLIAFLHGEEMQLQRDIATLDEAHDLTLWFSASDGLNNDAAVGFTRSFRREYPSWNVYCVSFPDPVSLTAVREATIHLAELPNLENEMSIDERGDIRVPRLTEIAQPQRNAPFDPQQPWELYGTVVSRVRTHLPRDGEVIVEIELLSDSSDAVRAFVGSRQVDGAHVVGLILPNPRNILCVPNSSLCCVPDVAFAHIARLPILAMAICGLALGQRLLDASDVQGTSIIVFPSDTQAGQDIVRVLTFAGAHVTSIPSTQSDYDVSIAHTGSAHVVLCGYTDAAKLAIARELLVDSGTLFSWNHSADGIPGILKHRPWAIASALSTMLPLVINHIAALPLLPYEPPVEILRRVSPAATAGHVREELFDPHRAYVLIGGIGSLGAQIALWMYKHGTRNLVLTSRSGIQSLIKRNDTSALRALAYLKAQKDLSISLHAVDATDDVETKRLLGHITVPIAGCMLVSALFVDNAFRRHTAESYAAAFAPKITAFRILENLLDIRSLDWFLAVSSFMAFLGNPGQTSYASANAILNGLLQPYPNACAIAAPLIVDSALAIAGATHMKHIMTWEFCAVVEDCILLLREGPIGIYVPDLAWDMLAKANGVAPYFQHLLKETETLQENEGPTTSIDDVIRAVLDVSASDFAAEVPLTSYGLDSLSAARLAQELKSFMKVTQMQLLSGISTNDLRERIEKSKSDDSGSAVQGNGVALSSLETSASRDEDEMLRLVQDLAQGLQRNPVSPSESELELAGGVILITGTTGTLGAAILARLASHPDISKIYALNRGDAEGLEERQQRAFVLRGLTVDLEAKLKIVHVSAILHQPDLGVAPSLMKEMQSSVTTIIHNAWPVNFNIPLSAFRQPLEGTRNLLRFALGSPRRTLPRFVFISTTATIYNAKLEAPALEVPSTSPGDAMDGGYSKSKWVAEALIARVSDQVADLNSTVVRVGVVSGAPNGAWDPSHWVPAMLAASKAMGSVPNADTVVSWIPLASAAAAITDAVLSSDTHRILHLVHPHSVHWSTLMKLVATEVGANCTIEGFDQWVERLEAASAKMVDAALRLLDFFHVMRDRLRLAGKADSDAYDGFMFPRLDMRRMIEMAPSLQTLPPLGAEDVRSWLAFSAASSSES